jgi:site-specific recombinase XerD
VQKSVQIMATVNPRLDTRYKSKDGTHQILVRVRHGKDLRDIPTGYKVTPALWKTGQVSGKHPDARIINSHIAHIIGQAKQYIAECQISKRPIRLDLIGKERQSYSWNGYLLHRAKQYAAKEMIIMERKVRRFDREFRVFNTPGLTFKDLLQDEAAGRHLRGNELYFDDLTGDLMRNFEAFLIKQGNVNNTRHKKFEFLGKFYTDAMNEGKAEGPNQFKLYKISQKPVKKEKLTEVEVKAIEDLQLRAGPVNDARNLWLFSYYCKGNRFETCITCRRDMITQGRVIFKMNKGEKFVSVKIHSRLQAIINQYQGDSEFLFPYIKERPAGKVGYIKKIDSLNVVVNRNLKTVADLAGIEKALTFHIARHTFAIHLKKKTDNIHVIKDAIGHSRSSTTEQYLQALDDEFLDEHMDKLYGE